MAKAVGRTPLRLQSIQPSSKVGTRLESWDDPVSQYTTRALRGYSGGALSGLSTSLVIETLPHVIVLVLSRCAHISIIARQTPSGN
eukprot:scaffold403_cov113-Cylindrotheca_fusiformis.AAC.5